MRLTRRKDGPIKRSKRGGRGRGDLQSFKSVHKFLQRGGAVGDISFTLAKLEFLISIHETKQGVLTILNRFKKVLQLGGLIKNKTVADLEGDNSRLKEPVVFDVKNKSDGLERVRTQLFIDYVNDTPDPAEEASMISLNKSKTSGFENDVNDIVMIMDDLFRILLVGSEPSKKRNDFLKQFRTSTYQPVDRSVDAIFEFILDGIKSTDLASSVLEYFNGIIEEMVTKFRARQTYYKLEEHMFLSLLKTNERLLSYFSVYKNKLNLSAVGKISDIIQKKITEEGIGGLINKTQTIDDIIETLFNHVLDANTNNISGITFVGGVNAKETINEEYINIMKAKEQKISFFDFVSNPDILITLQPLYSKTTFKYLKSASEAGPVEFRVDSYNKDSREYTSDTGVTVKLDNISEVIFSNPAEVVAPLNVTEGGDVPEGTALPE